MLIIEADDDCVLDGYRRPLALDLIVDGKGPGVLLDCAREPQHCGSVGDDATQKVTIIEIDLAVTQVLANLDRIVETVLEEIAEAELVLLELVVVRVAG